MRTELTARDIMQTDAVVVSPETSLPEARDVLLRHRSNGAVVCDDQGLVGVIGFSDIVRVALGKDFDDFPENAFYLNCPAVLQAELSAGLSEQLDDKFVEEAMTTELYTVSPDDRLSVVALTMRHHRLFRVVVVEGKSVVGLITALDLLQVLENH